LSVDALQAEKLTYGSYVHSLSRYGGAGSRTLAKCKLNSSHKKESQNHPKHFEDVEVSRMKCWNSRKVTIESSRALGETSSRSMVLTKKPEIMGLSMASEKEWWLV
jgi:hypothetical protein